MAVTNGINHLGLAVRNLKQSRDFFVDLLGWKESGYDPAYPRTAVGDGMIRLTLWQVDMNQPMVEFNRRNNVGLHHLALEILDQAELYALAEKLSVAENVEIEFMPELMGQGRQSSSNDTGCQGLDPDGLSTGCGVCRFCRSKKR